MSDSSFDYLSGNYYISAASLLLEFRCFIDTHPSLFKVNTANSVWPKMVGYCEELEKFPNVMRSITRLHINSQMDFERALFCAWCSLLVAKSLHLPLKHQRLLFIAGLLQDIGKYETLEPEQVINCKASSPFMTKLFNQKDQDIHSLVSANFVENNLPELEGLSELILMHHAKVDGTGFPIHISESQLELDNQILIIANEISDRLDRLGGHNQLQHAMPNLRLNGYLYFPKAHSHWVKLFEPYLPKLNKYIASDILLRETKEKIVNLEKMHGLLLLVSAQLLPYDFEPKIHVLRSWVRRLASLSTDTGIFDPHLFAELTGEAKVNACAVARDVDLILKGLPDILKRLIGFLDEIINTRKYDAYGSLLQEARHHMSLNVRDLDVHRISIFR
tara:strand:+ start:26120 stop:27289 length:1170 start_codon:yes stop_codon:yes gene_type:complete